MKTNHLAQLKKANAALLERGDIDTLAKYFAPDYVAHLTGKDLSGGHDMIRTVVDLYQKAFADITTNVEVLVQQADRVAWQRTIQATHRGPFKGFPATNLRMVWREMITSRFKDDLIVEEWFITDLAEQCLLARKTLKNSRG